MRQANNVVLGVEPQGCPDIIPPTTKGSVQFGFRQVACAKPRRRKPACQNSCILLARRGPCPRSASSLGSESKAQGVWTRGSTDQAHLLCRSCVGRGVNGFVSCANSGGSLRELAKRVDASYYTFISQLETGRGRIPPDRYQVQAQALDIDG